MRPAKEDYIPYYHYYIDLIKEQDVEEALRANRSVIANFIRSIPESKADHAYAEGKWTIKQVINHIIDTERIFCYRALRFSRGDAQPVPSFDENLYAANASLSKTSLELLATEFETVRDSSILFFKQLTEKELQLKGQTAAGMVNVLSIGYMVCGHGIHHMNIIKERYL